MSEEQRRQLQQQLWNIANTLRGKMGADEFRDYILGFIFYKYLSEKIERFANLQLAQENLKFSELDESTKQGKAYIEALDAAALDELGYFLKPSELFHAIALKGNNQLDTKNEGSSHNFILGDLTHILKNIEHSTMGTGSEEEFANLFEDIDLTSMKLGKTEAEKNDLISKVLIHLDKIDFNLSDATADVLGDAYEYLIGEFASGAGKKAGEFYTPQPVSTLLAKLVTANSRAFQLMNRSSVLGRYLPAFRKIVGQMQHDLFHVYTVDQHILMVLRNIRRFMVVEHTHEFPFCSSLIAHFEKPWLLVIAALFHDIAKGRGGDHSELGKADMRKFAKDHGLDKADTELLIWLVAEHLNMSQVAQKQDITDPEIVKAFAKKVGDERHLTALYLLTVADVRGTSPKVWNAWKGKLLEDLYRVTLRVLGGAKPDDSSELAQHQEESRAKLRLYGIEDHAYENLWNQLDVAFFLRQDAADIAWLTRHLFNKVESEIPVVCVRLSSVGEGLQIAVYVKDQEDLFARICAYFERHGFSIWDARIHTTKHGYALDTFQISGSNLVDEGGSYRDLIQLVEYELTAALQNNDSLPPPSMGRLSRQYRTFPTQPRVHVVPDERGRYYALSLSASDRTGLLYAISRVLAKHHVSVHTARINTLGERVEDVFLLDAANLSKNPKLQILLETDLLEALGT